MAAAAGVLAWVAGLSGGCASSDPMAQQSERKLRASVIEAAERELADALEQPAPVETDRNDDIGTLNIRPDIMPELEAMAGPGSYTASAPPLGVDLTGRPMRTVSISLERVIRSTVENNLAVQFARVQPSVNEAQVIAAEAAFDWTLFSNLQYQNVDAPRVSVNSNSGVDVQQQVSSTLGLRRQLVGGGRFTMQGDMGYTDNDTPGQTNRPNPAQQASVTLQWDQPLLRNFGSDVSRAEVRVARNAQRTSIQTLRRDLIRNSTDAERTYWQLVQAYAQLQISQRLVERGERVRDQLRERAQVDANSAQIADATARVERRRSDVLRAQTQLRLLSDQLKTLMNDPALPTGAEIVLLPGDAPVDAPIRFSLVESMRSAVQNRPEVQNSILTIDDASIRQMVADNQRLPDLNLRLQSRFAALDEDMGEAATESLSGQFIDYVVGLAFEMPVGNRRGEAEFRRRRLERMQAVLSYRNSVQQVVNEVKQSLNRITLNYPLIAQTIKARVASAENLRVLLVEKEQGGGYTVERLNVELNAQEQLAQAEREEIEALVEYNVAIAELFQAMGTTLERNNVDFVVPTTDDELANWQP